MEERKHTMTETTQDTNAQDADTRDEWYLFEGDPKVVKLIGKLARAIGIDEDDEEKYESFEAQVHLLLNKHAKPAASP